MITLTEKKLRILNILKENLNNPEPQVVAIDKIAGHLGLALNETRQLLLCLDEAGEIESDMEGHYSLITPAGLCRLTGMEGYACTDGR